MKSTNLLTAMLFYIFLVAFAGCSGAFEIPDEVRGVILSLNYEKGEIVIKDSFTGKEKTVIAEVKDMTMLQPGMRVKVKLKHATTIAEKIKIRAPGTPPQKTNKMSNDTVCYALTIGLEIIGELLC